MKQEVTIEELRERVYQAKKCLAEAQFARPAVSEFTIRGMRIDLLANQFNLLCNLIQDLEKKWWVDEAAQPFARRLREILDWAEEECG